MRKAYAVKRSDGKWLGNKRYSYSEGTYSPFTSFESARLFNRKVDAEVAARFNAPRSPKTAYVVTLSVTED